jgi:hypothetical protein
MPCESPLSGRGKGRKAVNKFPLRKGGNAERRGGCLTRPVARFEIRCAEVRLSPVRKTTPRRLRDCCRCAAAPFD